MTGIGLTPDGSRAVVTHRAVGFDAVRCGKADRDCRPALDQRTVAEPSGIPGAYIGMLPGKNASGARTVTGLETPPPKDGLVGGREFTLVADRLPSISDQSPVYYHGVQVGEVTGHELSDRDGSVLVRIFVYAPTIR